MIFSEKSVRDEREKARSRRGCRCRSLLASFSPLPPPPNQTFYLQDGCLLAPRFLLVSGQRGWRAEHEQRTHLDLYSFIPGIIPKPAEFSFNWRKPPTRIAVTRYLRPRESNVHHRRRRPQGRSANPCRLEANRVAVNVHCSIRFPSLDSREKSKSSRGEGESLDFPIQQMLC